jgi:hypothetical protein
VVDLPLTERFENAEPLSEEVIDAIKKVQVAQRASGVLTKEEKEKDTPVTARLMALLVSTGRVVLLYEGAIRDADCFDFDDDGYHWDWCPDNAFLRNSCCIPSFKVEAKLHSASAHLRCKDGEEDSKMNIRFQLLSITYLSDPYLINSPYFHYKYSQQQSPSRRVACSLDSAGSVVKTSLRCASTSHSSLT